jgi:hypothetical protein
VKRPEGRVAAREPLLSEREAPACQAIGGAVRPGHVDGVGLEQEHRHRQQVEQRLDPRTAL